VRGLAQGLDGHDTEALRGPAAPVIENGASQSAAIAGSSERTLGFLPDKSTNTRL